MLKVVFCALAVVLLIAGVGRAESPTIGKKELDEFKRLLDPAAEQKLFALSADARVDAMSTKYDLQGTSISVELTDLTKALAVTPAHVPKLGRAYGKIILRIGPPKLPPGIGPNDRAIITKHPFRFALEDIIKSMFGKQSGNYMATVTIRNPAVADANKAELAKLVATSANWETSRFLWITTEEKFSSNTIVTAVMLRGLLIDNQNNNLRAAVEVSRNEKFAMDVDSAQSFFSLVNKTNLIGNVDPLSDGLLKSFLTLATKVLSSASVRNITEIEELQFVRIDGLQTTKAFKITGQYDSIQYQIPGTISLETDASLLSSFDGTRFVAPIPEQIERDSIHPITGKSGWEYLSDSSDARIKLWAADMQAAKIPSEKAAECGEIYGKLLRVYTVHDAAAIYWATLKKLGRVENREHVSKYMTGCLADGKKAELEKLGLVFPE